MSDLENLQNALGYRFREPQHLQLALTHPSVAREKGTGNEHNQRLEFLGDAVLQLVLTRELFEKFANADEGSLTKARAQLVNRRSLAQQARRLDLGRYLFLSRGEERSGGRERVSALADGFEAVLGAIFLDSGFATAREFVLRQFCEVFGELKVLPNLDNPKGELQEFLQGQGAEAPRYELQSTTGPDHDREFECTVHFQGEELGRGKGSSKKEAESQAALAALERLQRQPIGMKAPSGS